MIDFRTKKTRTILVLSIIYILLLPLILAFMFEGQYDDFGLIYLLILGLNSLNDFIEFYTHGSTGLGWWDLFACIYFAPLVFYWIVFPIIRTAGRWVNRGQ
jgi:hypothetical protein